MQSLDASRVETVPQRLAISVPAGAQMDQYFYASLRLG
jgi:hypothetical protein